MTLFIVILSSNFNSNFKKETLWIPALLTTALTFIWWPREYASALPYGDSFGLSAIAMLLCFQQKNQLIKKTASVFLIGLANWINPLVTYYLIPVYLLLIIRSVYRKQDILINFIFSSTMGMYFIFFALEKGENSGFSLPSLNQFQELKQYLPLIILQFVNLLLYYLEKKNHCKVLLLKSLLITISIWPLILMLSTLNHIVENLYASRYFIPLITLGSAIHILHFCEWFRLRSTLNLDVSFPRKYKSIGVLIVLFFNILSYQTIARAVPLNEPWASVDRTMIAAVPNPSFVAGDYWYAWPLKMFVENPDSLIVLSHRMEGQSQFQDATSYVLQSKLVKDSRGICFGSLVNCQEYLHQVKEHMKLSFDTRIEFESLKKYSFRDTEAHAVKLNISSQEKKCWDGSELPTQIGQNTGRYMVAPLGISGFLTFGPYIPLGPGSYEAFVDYKVLASQSHENLGYLDRANIGLQEIGSKVYLRGNSSDFQSIKTSFTVETYIPKFELRVFSNGAAKIELQQICLIKR
jgi:hypothetical protein